MKRKKPYAIIGYVSIWTVLIFSSCQSQPYKNIEITKNWNSKTSFQTCEPSIAINPLKLGGTGLGNI